MYRAHYLRIADEAEYVADVLERAGQFERSEYAPGDAYGDLKAFLTLHVAFREFHDSLGQWRALHANELYQVIAAERVLDSVLPFTPHELTWLIDLVFREHTLGETKGVPVVAIELVDRWDAWIHADQTDVSSDLLDLEGLPDVYLYERELATLACRALATALHDPPH